MKFKIDIIISTVSIVGSVIAICISAYRTDSLGFDYQGVIVGILALLVTVLIGWQIFMIFDIKRIKDDVLNVNYENYIRSEKNLIEIQMSLSDFYLDLYTINSKRQIGFSYLLHSISAIIHQSRINDINSANAIIKRLISTIVDPSKVILRQIEYNSLLNLIYSIENKEGINDICTLLALVSRMTIDDKKL